MKKLLSILLLVFCHFIFLSSTFAAEPTCWCTGANGSSCTRYSNSCPSGDAKDYEGFSICCNDKNLYNSVFALKSPICGSATEKPVLGCERGTFADGNSMLFCIGNEFRLGQTDPIFDGKDNVNFDPGGSFTYNGNTYSSGNVYVCNSIASCCAQGSEGFRCEDITKPNPYEPPPLTDNSALPNDKRAPFCGLTGEADDDFVRYVHTNIGEYELTCTDTPVIDVVRDTCSTDAGGEGAPYGKITQVDPITNQDYIDIQALVGLISAKLGGYGPDTQTSRSRSPDTLNKTYPYNAFLNLPLSPKVPKEAFGSFWRLTSQIEVMNARAKLIQRFRLQTPPMRDQDITYAGTEGDIEEDADGALLADYMNAVIEGVGADSKIKLLSPAFNITSRFTPPLVKEMFAAGAQFDRLAGCAGNTYTVAGRGAMDWYNDFLNNTGLGGCNFVFTEFGDFDTFGKPLDTRPDVISRMTNEFGRAAGDGSVMGVLYFNALGGNPEFTGHQLSQAEYSAITHNSSKAGVNSARGFDGGAFQNQAANYTGNSGWTLEIAFSPGDATSVANAINTAHSRGLTPVVRICVGDTCDFSDPEVYVKFLKDVAGRVNAPFYAIAGPNEPERERWVEGGGSDIPTVQTKTFKLSQLINELPVCLTAYPICPTASESYASLDPETKIKYDALIPFNQDNLRGYLAVNYIEPVERRTNVGILTEGLGFIEALIEALNEESFGLLRSISPQWLDDARKSVTTSDNYIPKEQEKGNGGIISAVGDKAKSIWPADTLEDNPKNNQLGCFLHKDGITLPAPTTYPKDLAVDPPRSDWVIKSEPFPKSLYQFVRVPVKTTVTQNSDRCPIKVGGATIGYGTRYETKVIDGPGRRDEGSYLVSNIGRSIAVLNNPKMTDISRLISEPKGESNLSMEAQFLPEFAKKEEYTNTPILAPGASYDSTIYFFTDPATQDKAKAGGTESSSGNIARKGGQAHIDLCVLRSYWLRPSGLQKGSVENCGADPSSLLDSLDEIDSSTGIPTKANCNESATAGAAGSLLPLTQLLSQSFASGASSDNLSACYNDLVSRSNSAGYDPAFTMAIWLEESAASLYSAYPNVADFGCTVNTPKMNFNSQINCFLGLIRSYSGGDLFKECRGSDDRLSMREFLLIYEGGFQSCRAGDFTIEPQFPSRIQQYYSQVTGGRSLDLNQILSR